MAWLSSKLSVRSNESKYTRQPITAQRRAASRRENLKFALEPSPILNDWLARFTALYVYVTVSESRTRMGCYGYVWLCSYANCGVCLLVCHMHSSLVTWTCHSPYTMNRAFLCHSTTAPMHLAFMCYCLHSSVTMQRCHSSRLLLCFTKYSALWWLWHCYAISILAKCEGLGGNRSISWARPSSLVHANKIMVS